MLMRSLGLKRTLLLGVAVAALSTIALYWAPTVSVAVLLRVFAGFGRALSNVSQHSYVANAVSVGTRGRAISSYGGVMRGGRFLGPMLGGVIASEFGFRSTFLLNGATCIAALVAVAIFVRIQRQETPAATSQSGGKLLLAAVRENYRILAGAGTGQILAQTIRAGRQAIIPLYAADILGLDIASIGVLLSLASAMDMALFYPAGWIMDHLGRKFAIVPSFLIQAVGMFLVPFTSTFAGLFAAVSLVSLGNGIGAGSMMTLGADLAPERTQAEFLGIWRLIGDGGRIGGPVVVGQIAELVALPVAAWAIAATGLCAAVAFHFLVPEPLKNGASRRLKPEAGV